ncbi:MAG: ABC transporter ATP-binding protein [Patescibacteria group bacterium]
MNALEINHLTKKYDSMVAVDDISLTIEQGDFFGFLGPNGAGKTTTIKCITGIGLFQSGSISVFGIDVVKEYREARKKIGLAPQEFNIDIFAKPRDILYYVGGFYGMPRLERLRRIDEVLERFELTAHASKPFQALSGGLKRRVMLARAMIHDPDLLILDEPTAGVDVELRHDLWRYLQELNAAGKTILFTSHYLEEVEMLCKRIAIIDKGKIAAIGSKSDFTEGGKKLEQTYLDITQKGKTL